MTDPCLIVRGPDRPNSQKHDLEVPVSPYKVSKDVDLDHPLEHSREPSKVPPINRRPARKTVEVRARKHDANAKGLHGKVRQIRWPELFHLSRYSVDLIESQRAANPPPPHVDVWVQEVIASGVPEDQRDRFVVALHPGFRRWALFERLNRPDIGPHFRLVSMAMMKPREGYLPPDLQSTDRRWDHMRGEIGDYREFTKQDFVIIREQADRRLLGSVGVCKKAEARESAEYEEKCRVEDDFVADMLDYTFWWLNSAANYGRRSYSLATVPVGQNPEKYHFEDRGTYTERIRKGTRRYQELMLSKVGIDVNAKPEIREGLSRPLELDPLLYQPGYLSRVLKGA